MHGDDLVAAAGGNGYVFSRDLNSGPWVPTQLSGHILSVANTATEIVATSARSAFFTYDGGATWTEKGPFSNSGFYAVAASTGAALKQPAVFIASASNAGRSELYRSVDAGESWELADTLTETLDMLTYSDRIYLAQADGLRVWPINTSSGTAGYGSSSPGVRLFPPMPNPVGDQAEIRYAVDRPGGLRIELFDALGRRVAVLLDEFVSSGVAKVILQTGRLTPGHYFMHARHGTGVATQSISVVR